jgi:excisionase family DNA binding protein
MEAPPAEPPRLGDAHAIARILKVSAATVRRMARAGRMPGSVRIGDLHRWDIAAVNRWIDAGCPPQKAAKRRDVK